MTIDRLSYWTHPGISQSMLKDLDPPAYFYAKYVAKTVPQDDTEALRRGLALHALLLEPESFDVRFPVFEGERRTNVAKAAYAQLEGAATMLDGCVLRDVRGDGGELSLVRSMAESIQRHPRASRLLATMIPGTAECPLEWDDPITGVRCKMRTDFAARLGETIAIVDLKKATRGGTTTENVERSILRWGWHLQAAHYLAGARANGVDASDYYLILVEDEAPFCTRVVRMDPRAIDAGAATRAARLDLLATCRAEERWPGPANDLVETVGLPRWAA